MLSYLLFGGGMCMVLIGFVWLVQPDGRRLNAYFTVMYVSTGLIVLYAWAERSGTLPGAYLAYNMQIPLCYLFAPFLYYGFSEIAELEDGRRGVRRLHLAPAVVSFAAILAVNIAYASELSALAPGSSTSALRAIPAFAAIHVAGLASNLYIFYFLIRIILSGVRIFRTVAQETIKELGLLLVFVVLFFLDVLLMMAAHLLGDDDLLHLAKFLSSATFLLYAFYSFRYPEYAQRAVRKAKGLRYRTTQLRGLDVDSLLARLEYLMSTERIYRDMELSLASLSAQLMCTPHQLSEILNERLNRNFPSYLNQRRVREAAELLLRKPGASVIEIAFDVGFRSKASFNDNFRKITGLSPSEYRESKPGNVGEPRLARAAAGDPRHGGQEKRLPTRPAL